MNAVEGFPIVPDVGAYAKSPGSRGSRRTLGRSVVLTRNRIAAMSSTTGVATGWNPNSKSTVSALAIGGGRVFADGVS